MATYEDALKKYPDWAWAFNIPEVGNLLKKGVEDPNYDPIPEILQTNWYRTTQASARQWQALMQKDPESANARLREKEAVINDMRQRLGIAPDVDWQRDAAQRSLQYGWSDDQLNDYMVSLLKYNPQVQSAPGSISTYMQQLKKNAAQYLITLSDDTAFNYAKAVAAGEHQMEDWTGVWAEQAKQQFPTLAGAIDKGITPTQYFSPIKDRIANILEINPEQVDLTSTKYSKVLAVTDDKGNSRPMNYNEVDQFARSQDEFKSTRQGQQAAADMAQTLMTMFGKVA